MNIGSLFHKIVDGVHHLFVSGEHVVETVKLYLDARPGLKADLDKLLDPIKVAVEAAFKARFAELQAASAATKAIAAPRQTTPQPPSMENFVVQPVGTAGAVKHKSTGESSLGASTVPQFPLDDVRHMPPVQVVPSGHALPGPHAN